MDLIKATLTVSVIASKSIKWNNFVDLLVPDEGINKWISVVSVNLEPITMEGAIQRLECPTEFFGFQECSFCGLFCHEESDDTVPGVRECDLCGETICSDCWRAADSKVLCPDCYKARPGETVETLADMIAGDESDGVYHAIAAELEGF